MLDLSVVIVSYKVRDLLLSCLKSIYRHRGDLQLEVIVVDNCSNDGSSEMIQDQFPAVRLVRNKRNLGFAGANNQGIHMSAGRNVLFLNPDTVILDDALKKTVEFIDGHPGAGVVGCKILNPDGTLQYSCRGFPYLLDYFFESTFLYKIFPKNRLMGRFYMTHFDYDRTKEVDVVLGAFMLVKKEVLDEIGVFDEGFFIYSEETDLCYRIKKSGKKVLFFPGAQIIHHGGASTSFDSVNMMRQEHRSRYLFMRKHHRAFKASLSAALIGMGVVLRLIVWSMITGYCAVFDDRKLTRAQKKISIYGHLLAWYLLLGFAR